MVRRTNASPVCMAPESRFRPPWQLTKAHLMPDSANMATSERGIQQCEDGIGQILYCVDQGCSDRDECTQIPGVHIVKVPFSLSSSMVTIGPFLDCIPCLSFQHSLLYQLQETFTIYKDPAMTSMMPRYSRNVPQR